MVQLFPEFNWEIVPDTELVGVEGLTLPNEHLIILPETVYWDAAAGMGRARFSVAHEISHYFQIDSKTVALCRAGMKLPPYRDPEWQANTLAAELLIPPNLSIGMYAEEIVHAFGVSLAAANVHIKQKYRENLP
jgi:Zn-dependent peptidase ImmA (M78 family)